MRSTGMRALALVVGLSACEQDLQKIGYQDRVDVWQQSPTDMVDILWVVDNSNSMQLEQELLASGFASFAANIDASGVDFQIGVISTDFDYDDPERGVLLRDDNAGPVITRASQYTKTDPAPGESALCDYRCIFQERAQIGLNGSGKEKGLEAAAYALSPTMATSENRGFLRDDATLLIIFVTDEDDCSDAGALGLQDNTACYTERDLLTPVSEFVAGFEALKTQSDKVRIGAIVGPEQASGLCDDTTIPGRRYLDVTRLIGGLSASICEADWSGVLGELGLEATGIYTTFTLSHGAVDGTLEVFLDEQPVPESAVDGYTYDAVAHAITFHGIWIPERGAAIKASYLIEPGT